MPTLLGYALTALGAVVVAAIGYLGVRYTSRSARLATVNSDSSEWERRYRYNAEQHLRWDIKIMSRLQRVEQQVGIDEPIEDPPPLFPEPTVKDRHE